MPGPVPDVAASHRAPREGGLADLDAWYRLVICGRPEQVSVARAFVRQVLGFGHPGTERVTLLTSELVTNSVNHSDSRREGGSITVTVRTAADRVRVEVQDAGGPTAPVLRCDGDLAEAGRGLRLVEAYSLRWDYHQNGTGRVTWFECLPEPLPLRIVRQVPHSCRRLPGGSHWLGSIILQPLQTRGAARRGGCRGGVRDKEGI